MLFDTDTARRVVTTGEEPGVGRWRAIAQVKGLSTEMYIVVAGRTASGSGRLQPLMRQGKGEATDRGRRPSQAITGIAGTWETRHPPGTVIVIERRVKAAVMGCRESDQLIVAG